MQSCLVRFPLLLLACCVLLDAARAEEPKISTDEGNWGLGRRLFHSAELGCFKCHMLDGSGGNAGPDLSKLKDQDASSVLHAITNPRAEVASQYVGQQTQMPDGLVFFQKGTWNDQRQEQLDQYLSLGGGAVYVHWAVNGVQRVGDSSKRIGLASKAGGIRYRHGPLTLDIHITEHPIVRNFD